MNKKMFCFLLGIIILIFSLHSNMHSTITPNNPLEIVSSQKLSSLTDSPLIINGNAQLANYASKGSGSKTDPYIIENYFIGANSSITNGISITNTTDYFILRNNTITGSYTNGIYLNSDQNATIENNKVTNSEYGIYSHGSWHNSIINNTVTKITLDYSFAGILINNTVMNSNSYGISVFYSGFTYAYNNLVQNSSGDGFKIERSDNSRLIDNTFRDNSGNGLSVFNSNNILIENNSFLNNKGDGSNVGGLTDATIKNNIAIDNQNSGIYLNDAVKSSLENNVAISNNFGIYLDGSDSNIIQNNEVSYSNRFGIELISSNGNKIFLNNITKSQDYGIYLTTYPNYGTDTGNLIYLNRIISNNQNQPTSFSQAYCDNSNNSFTIDQWGNYWSDYTSTKASNTYIGSVPYLIDGSSTSDNHPLLTSNFALLTIPQSLTASKPTIDSLTATNNVVATSKSTFILFIANFETIIQVALVLGLIGAILLALFQAIKYRNTRLRRRNVTGYDSHSKLPFKGNKTKQALSEETLQKLEELIDESTKDS